MAPLPTNNTEEMPLRESTIQRVIDDLRESVLINDDANIGQSAHTTHDENTLHTPSSSAVISNISDTDRQQSAITIIIPLKSDDPAPPKPEGSFDLLGHFIILCLALSALSLISYATYNIWRTRKRARPAEDREALPANSSARAPTSTNTTAGANEYELRSISTTLPATSAILSQPLTQSQPTAVQREAAGQLNSDGSAAQKPPSPTSSTFVNATQPLITAHERPAPPTTPSANAVPSPVAIHRSPLNPFSDSHELTPKPDGTETRLPCSGSADIAHLPTSAWEDTERPDGSIAAVARGSDMGSVCSEDSAVLVERPPPSYYH